MPAKLFVIIITLLTSLLVLTSPPVLTWIVATPTPIPTATPLPPTATPAPSPTPDPFANVPTATPLGDPNPLQPLPMPTMLPTVPPTAVPTPFNQTLLRIGWSRPADFVSPLAGPLVGGRVSQGFGCSVYYSGRRGHDCPASAPWFHDGLDLAAPAGTPVRAALSGIVTFAGPDRRGPKCGRQQGYGLSIVIETGEWQALYAHLAEIFVTPDQRVEPDTVIGTVGDSGCVSGGASSLWPEVSGAVS